MRETNIFMQSRVPLGPGKFHVVVLVPLSQHNNITKELEDLTDSTVLIESWGYSCTVTLLQIPVANIK